MSATRAKFVVDSLTRLRSGFTEVKASPVCSTDPNHENKAFWDATPAGELRLQVRNDSLAGFEPGVEFYVDLTIVPKGA